ncbi:MAG TPA: FAD-dependent oxidoreductase [Gemmatimonadaceae bacterium]|nr:FAD-dependent oxidoreductase [Gemmatimonadaceae bacterium]
MSAQTELSGPDLAAGIALAEIPDGGSLTGHFGGDAVLLTRRGGEVTAIGATCTHYSGPLSEGLIVGTTVRCPWHHACFDVRTGEALRAPALNPVPTFRVAVEKGRVTLTEKLERDPLARAEARSPRTTPAPSTIVIVGAGAAGSAAAEMLRREGFDGRITLIDPDSAAPYDRPNLSKDYLAGNAPEEWIPLRPPGFYEKHGIEVVRRRVAALEPARRQITLDDRRELGYDRLLLATGADPIRLDIPGANRPEVHLLRSLADSGSIIAGAEAGRRAVVVGASFIGLEVAGALRARGLDVDVVAPEAVPFERVLGVELGRFIRGLHEEHGVRFHLGDTPKAIGDGGVALTSGGTLGGELVVFGVGVRPSMALAQGAGLAIDRGVLVNEFLETSAPDVFAAGDIARWPDAYGGGNIRVEHWVVAQRQGQTVARNMLGARERFADVPFFWSQHYDVTIAYVGHAERWDRIDVAGSIEGRDCSVAYRLGDRTPAVASIFRDRVSLEVEAAIGRGDWRAVQLATAR